MAFLMDLPALLRGAGRKAAPLPASALQEGSLGFVSVLAVGELLRLSEASADPGQRERLAALAEAVASTFPLLPVDLATSRAFARLQASASHADLRPGFLWPAACCVAHGLTLITVDPTPFRGIPGLQVEQWT